MDWRYLFTSLEGRINRQKFWMGVIVLAVIGVVASILDKVIGSNVSNGVGVIGIIVTLIEIYPSICLSGKRWHDRGKSAWWILIAIIPIIGWIWALVETGFLKGTTGPNKYGADPLQG